MLFDKRSKIQYLLIIILILILRFILFRDYFPDKEYKIIKNESILEVMFPNAELLAKGEDKFNQRDIWGNITYPNIRLWYGSSSSTFEVEKFYTDKFFKFGWRFHYKSKGSAIDPDLYELSFQKDCSKKFQCRARIMFYKPDSGIDFRQGYQNVYKISVSAFVKE